MPTRFAPLILLVACMNGYPPTDSPEVSSPSAPEQKQKLDSYLFVDSLHEIRFHVSTHMHMSLGVQCQVERITVTDKGAAQPFSSIPVAGMLCPCPTAEGQFPGVQLLDFNFDGHKDIRVMRAAKDLTNPEHRYWLWDGTQRTFVASAMLDSIQQPMFDHERQMVSSQWYDGPDHRGGSTFRYQDGTLTMVSNMEKFKDGDHERWVIWGIKDGRLQPVQEKEVPLSKP